MFLSSLKNKLLDARSRPVRILLGPFRGATICMSLRENLRKVFGVYEHELNDWLASALTRVDCVMDIGANDGYFAFGCAAAFRRLGKKTARIIAFEPQPSHCEQLRASVKLQTGRNDAIAFAVEQTLVGKEVTDEQTTLDALTQRAQNGVQPRRALVKIDVEGAEIDVIEGGALWLDQSNYFLIEVHEPAYVKILQDRFSSAGISLKLITQKPLPIWGREQRQESNCWLVTPLK